MKLKILILPFIIFINLSNYSLQKIGMTRLYSFSKSIDPVFNLKLEDKILSLLSDIPSSEILMLDFNENKEKLKNYLKIIDQQQNNSTENIKNFYNELKSLDYCFYFELNSYNLSKEEDFYNPDKFIKIFTINLNVILINCKNKTIIDEDFFLEEIKSLNPDENIKIEAINKISQKIKNYLDDLIIFKPKIYSEKINSLFIKLNKGKIDNIKTGNILISYTEENDNIIEHTAVKVIKAYDEYSIAGILYTKGQISPDQYFIKKNNINLELQICGGFSLSNKENEVSSANQLFSFIPSFSIRTFIPLPIAYFRPCFNMDINIIYTDNKVIIPFTFEAGCQGEFNIHRFETDIGLMFGALFSPDKNNNYKTDSFIVRPYLHFSALLNVTTKLFAEAGYKYFLEGVLYKDYQINLSGAYFLFGISINL
ncbi:MAG: hypothetical protein JXB50_00845 [Spirochaetes bacterium]|nr:hypothetical protein [Spirochaetota bacterium]